MIFEAIPSFRDKWELLQKQCEILTRQSLRLALARTRHERQLFRTPRRGPQETEFGLPWGGFVDSRVIPKDSEGDSQGSEPKLQNVQRELKNDPHVDSWTSLESMPSGTQTRFRRVPSDLRGSRTGFPGVPRRNP